MMVIRLFSSYYRFVPVLVPLSPISLSNYPQHHLTPWCDARGSFVEKALYQHDSAGESRRRSARPSRVPSMESISQSQSIESTHGTRNFKNSVVPNVPRIVAAEGQSQRNRL